jgi:hypothetical protein
MATGVKANSLPGSTWSRLRYPLILAFLFWHFSGVLLWLSPDCPLKQKLIPPFLGYLNFFGFWQGWSVFETPRTYNEYLTSVVTFQDGSQQVWEFPRMEKMSVVEKMFKEGFRRWSNDCVSDKDDAFLWPDTVRYIAKANTHPGRVPTTVSIVRHWTWIDPPATGINKPLRTTDDGQEVLYTSPISVKELE